LKALNDPDQQIQAGVIPLLIASQVHAYQKPAMRRLRTWLDPRADPDCRRLARQVLRHIRDTGLPQAARQWSPGPENNARATPPWVIRLNAEPASPAATDTAPDGIVALSRLLAATDEAVRLAAVEALGHLHTLKASLALLKALRDPSFAVRRRACAVMDPLPRASLATIAQSDSGYAAECATLLLACAERSPGGEARLKQRINQLLTDAYRLHVFCQPLHGLNTPGAHALKRSLQAQVEPLIARIFWMSGVCYGEQAAQAIQHALASPDLSRRANATEVLETLTSRRFARLLATLATRSAADDPATLPELSRIGQELLGLQPPTLAQLCGSFWPQLTGGDPEPWVARHLLAATPDGWLTAATICLVRELQATGATNSQSNGSAAWLDSFTLRRALHATVNDPRALVRTTARQVRAQLAAQNNGSAGSSDHAAELTLIEKLFLLNRVPGMQHLSVEHLRRLATVSEEVRFARRQRVTTGETGGAEAAACYLIIAGQVGRYCRGRSGPAVRSILGPGDSFADRAGTPDTSYLAEAIALTPTRVLLVRRAVLATLLQGDPELGVALEQALARENIPG
jgi:CRP-like cAMP-binding protein/HEAT repeat protein